LKTLKTLFRHGGSNTKNIKYKSKQKEHETQHKHTMKMKIFLKNGKKGKKHINKKNYKLTTKLHFMCSHSIKNNKSL